MQPKPWKHIHLKAVCLPLSQWITSSRCLAIVVSSYAIRICRRQLTGLQFVEVLSACIIANVDVLLLLRISVQPRPIGLCMSLLHVPSNHPVHRRLRGVAGLFFGCLACAAAPYFDRGRTMRLRRHSSLPTYVFPRPAGLWIPISRPAQGLIVAALLQVQVRPARLQGSMARALVLPW